jgi:hypothetical protein
MKRKNRLQSRPRNDRTGEVYNRLEVVGFSHYEVNKKSPGRKIYWDCICECGKDKKVENSRLISGNTKSCGCLKDEALDKLHEKNANKDSAFMAVLRAYKNNADQRNLSFSLTKEQFGEITKMNCYYCGSEPSNIKDRHGKKRKYKNVYIYNGVDRKSNNEGYFIKNCVPCCRECNLAKGTRSEDEFLSWVDRVHDYKNKDDNK